MPLVHALAISEIIVKLKEDAVLSNGNLFNSYTNLWLYFCWDVSKGINRKYHLLGSWQQYLWSSVSKKYCGSNLRHKSPENSSLDHLDRMMTRAISYPERLRPPWVSTLEFDLSALFLEYQQWGLSWRLVFSMSEKLNSCFHNGSSQTQASLRCKVSDIIPSRHN